MHLLVVAPGQGLLLGLLLGAGSQVTGRLVLAALAFHKVPGIGVLLELVELPEGQALPRHVLGALVVVVGGVGDQRGCCLKG